MKVDSGDIKALKTQKLVAYSYLLSYLQTSQMDLETEVWQRSLESSSQHRDRQ